MTASRSPAPAEESAATGDGAAEAVASLQEALQTEHAAVYGYAFIGARTDDEERERCRRHLDAHRAQRDSLRAALVDRGVVPASAEAAYALPESDDHGALVDFARSTEAASGRAALQLAGVPAGPLREFASSALQAATVRGLEWGAETVPFPGYPDPAVPEPSPAPEHPAPEQNPTRSGG